MYKNMSFAISALLATYLFGAYAPAVAQSSHAPSRRAEGLPLVNRSIAVEEKRMTAKFSRGKEFIVIELEWHVESEPIYSKYGRVRALTVIEKGKKFVFPKTQIRGWLKSNGIDEMFPGYLRVVSPRLGKYSIDIPYGVPVGISSVVFDVDDAIYSMREVDRSYPALKR